MEAVESGGVTGSPLEATMKPPSRSASTGKAGGRGDNGDNGHKGDRSPIGYNVSAEYLQHSLSLVREIAGDFNRMGQLLSTGMGSDFVVHGDLKKARKRALASSSGKSTAIRKKPRKSPSKDASSSKGAGKGSKPKRGSKSNVGEDSDSGESVRSGRSDQEESDSSGSRGSMGGGGRGSTRTRKAVSYVEDEDGVFDAED